MDSRAAYYYSTYLHRMDFIYVIDLAGTFVFALSGLATAANRKFDIFGASIIALVTAVGGGTIRDVLIGSQPVGWMKDLNYLLMIGLSLPVGFFFQRKIMTLRRTLFLFDAIGIGLFTILGLTKTLNAGLSPAIAIMMGTVSAVFGGVLRDVLCNEVPLIFGKEIYASACLSGGILFLVLRHFGLDFHTAMILTMGFIILIRILAVTRHWELPKLKY